MGDKIETPVRMSLRQRKTTSKAQEYMETRQSSVQETHSSENEFSGDEVVIKDTVASACAGKEIFSFEKVKKHERLLNTPKTPKTEKVAYPKTPHDVRKCIDKGIKTSLKMDLSSDEDPFADNSGSEYSNNSTSSNSSTASSSSSNDEEVDDEDDDEDETEVRNKPLSQRVKQGSVVKQKTTKTQKYVIKTDEYFSNNAMKKSTTSNHTLDRLKTPRLNQDELSKLLKKLKVSEPHHRVLSDMATDVRNNYDRWISLLHENFNVLVYGLGSKKNILNDFHETMLKDLPVVVINGFFPSLTLKNILDAIIVDLLESRENPANVFDACELIAREFEAIPEQHLYVLVHNIEGDMLRNNKCQSVLSRLGSIRNIHLIASIDHINAPLIWDHSKLSKFNFIWWDVTSFRAYTDETAFESSMMVQRTGNLALSSLRNIFLSLTSNSKGIYMSILNYQLEHNSTKYYQGLLFKDLYSSCREAFLVSSDLALRAQLTEFIDHKMVKTKRAADGGEYLTIPIANNLLQQFMAEQGK